MHISPAQMKINVPLDWWILPSGDVSLPSNPHICSCLCAVCAWLHSPCWQTCCSFQIQQASPLQSCSLSGHRASSQCMAEEADEQDTYKSHQSPEKKAHNDIGGYLLCWFCCLPQASVWGSQDHTYLLPPSKQVRWWNSEYLWIHVLPTDKYRRQTPSEHCLVILNNTDIKQCMQQI